MAIDTDAVCAIALTEKSRRRFPRVKWERNKNAHPTKNLSAHLRDGSLLFGVTRFCRQRVREVPLAEYGLGWKPWDVLFRDFVAHRDDDRRAKAPSQ
jgi:hypothetical protein